MKDKRFAFVATGSLIAFWFGVATFAPCAEAQTAAVTETPAKPLDLEGPRVYLPSGVTAAKNDTKMDFVTFRFNVSAPGGNKEATKQILFVYVGTSPNFPQEAAPKAAIERAFVRGKPAKTVTWTSKTGGLCRETLVYTRRPDFARYLHFIYSDLSKADAQIADAIIASAEAGPPPPGKNWPDTWPDAVNGRPLP